MTMSHAGTCRVCARPLTLHQRYAGGVCGDWRCREGLLADALLAHRREAGEALGIDAVEAYPIAVVPRRAFNRVPLAAQRRDAFAQYLRDLLAAAAAESQPPQDGAEAAPPSAAGEPAADGAVQRLLAAVCGVCGGFCCFYGGARHAFLDADAMAAFRRRHPRASDGEVLAAYLDSLPAEHCADSCVYHTATGCALPRPMRARICNAYECGGLRDARHGAAGGGARACVVVRQDNRIIRSAFLDPDGIASYPPER